MIRLAVDENDLQKLVKAGKASSNLTFLNQLANIRISDASGIAFDVIFSEWYKPNVSVRLYLSKASARSLYIDFILGAQNRWVPDTFISGLNRIASWFYNDMTNILEQKCTGTLTRKSLSCLSFDLQTFCRERLRLPFIINIADISFRQKQFSLKVELLGACSSYNII